MMGTVEFYENVNRLQEVIEASEDHRLDLNRQFIMALKTDVIKDKRNISQLQAYWKQICDNEARSRDRNAKLLDDIDRIERNMGALARKTERLRSMKKQYEDYVERMYPQWRGQLQAQLSPEPIAERLQSPDQSHPVRDSPPVRAMRTPPAVLDSRARSAHESPLAALQPSRVPPLELSALRSTGSTERRSGSDLTGILTASTAARGDWDAPPATGKSDITAVTPIAVKSTLDGKKEQRVSFDMSTLKRVLDSDEEDDDVEFEVPILSSRESTPKAREVMRVEVQNHPPPTVLRSNGDMPSPVRPALDLSGPYDPPKLTVPGLFHLLQFVEEEVKNMRSSPALRKPMLYRSSTPKDCVADEVINLGNAFRDPAHLNPVSISMVIGDQLPAIVWALPQSSLLSDVIVMDFVNSTERPGEEFISSRLPADKLELWNRLLVHFRVLVRYQLLKPQELAELFAASLIYYDSRLEAKAIDMIAAVLEDSAIDTSLTEDSTSMTTPRAAVPPTVTFSRRDANPLGDSLLATAGSFNDTTPLKVTRNPELRSTESDTQLLYFRNALRAKDESDDEEEEFDSTQDTAQWKKKQKEDQEEEEEEEESNDLDVPDGVGPTPFISASIQNPAISSSLKDSDAYQKMLGRSSQRKSSTNSSDDDDIEMMLSGPGTRTSLPAVREIDISDSGERTPDGRPTQASAPKPLSTQELLHSVMSKDPDDFDIDTSSKPWTVAQKKTQNADADDFDFGDFYQ